MSAYCTSTARLSVLPATAVRRMVREAIERHMDRRRLEVLGMVKERGGIRGLLGLGSGLCGQQWDGAQQRSRRNERLVEQIERKGPTRMLD
jgi:hypothetical protein